MIVVEDLVILGETHHVGDVQRPQGDIDLLQDRDGREGFWIHSSHRG